jgi:hypothetical protein
VGVDSVACVVVRVPLDGSGWNSEVIKSDWFRVRGKCFREVESKPEGRRPNLVSFWVKM